VVAVVAAVIARTVAIATDQVNNNSAGAPATART